MFRTMRRSKQELSKEESVTVLERGTSGVLAVCGEGDYPYAVPLSYVYHDNRLYFHCAKSGHKLDAIASNDHVSFCVIDKDEIVPEKYTTYFRSVIAFGTAKVLEGTEKRAALELLAKKYSPDQVEGRLEEIKKFIDKVCMVEVTIEQLTGKEAIELVREKEANQ